ncbi:MAG: malate synthase A [Deltaproteobacteria bacterium]|nr:malate synthase A [Deltaproteobacteria bacterium]
MNAAHGEPGGDLEVSAPAVPRDAEVLTREALGFVEKLEREFGDRRREVLVRRAEVQAGIDGGARLDFPSETAAVRDGEWSVGPIPADLEDRRVEITGPVERKMMINALNSGARVFMADFEDALSPTWSNLIQGQVNVRDAVRRTIAMESADGKSYRLRERTAVLVVRPRGWHLEERHVRLAGRPVSASLFDFGLSLFHNARELLERGSGPYFYLPKLQSRGEARLWNDVFLLAEQELGLPRGSIKATVLIETILAALEMEEILYELREHVVGLNAGRWDYLFSVIKTFRNRPGFVLPDRAQLAMTVPFLRAYTERMVQVCHRRGAHAIGGMAAFVPSRRDPAVNERAFRKVTEDKERESGDGFDGTWVAHPDLVPVAQAVFDRRLGPRPHQKDRLREDVRVAAPELLDFRVPGGRLTEGGLRNDVGVGLQYVESWLRGTGAVAILDLMEDTATAEIARSQVWQWIHGPDGRLDDGRKVAPELYRSIADQEMAALRERVGAEAWASGRWAAARRLFDRLVLDERFEEFLTRPAYEELEPG